MRVPVTDAFDEADETENRTVELTPEQIDWLERKAESQGLSVDHVLRSIVTAAMRKAKEDPSPSAPGGDGAPKSSVSSSPTRSGNPGANKKDEDKDDGHSIVESLRSANQQLQDLTDEGDSNGESDTVSRLQARVDSSSDQESSADDSRSESVLRHDQNRSMFDMVED